MSQTKTAILSQNQKCVVEWLNKAEKASNRSQDFHRHQKKKKRLSNKKFPDFRTSDSWYFHTCACKSGGDSFKPCKGFLDSMFCAVSHLLLCSLLREVGVFGENSHVYDIIIIILWEIVNLQEYVFEGYMFSLTLFTQ